MNLHPKRSYYDRVACNRMKPTGNVQRWVGYQGCFGRRRNGLSNSRDVEIVQNAGSLFKMGVKENGGVGG